MGVRRGGIGASGGARAGITTPRRINSPSLALLPCHPAARGRPKVRDTRRHALAEFGSADGDGNAPIKRNEVRRPE